MIAMIALPALVVGSVVFFLARRVLRPVIPNVRLRCLCALMVAAATCVALFISFVVWCENNIHDM